MSEESAKFYINYSLNCGIDFSELFYEEKCVTEIKYQDSKVETIKNSYLKGLGIRLAYKDKISYGNTSNFDKNNILSIIDDLKSNYSKKRVLDKLNTFNKEENKKELNEMSGEEKKKILGQIESICQSKDKRIEKVFSTLSEIKQNIIVANSKGKYVKDTRINSILIVNVMVKDKDKTTSASKRFGYSSGCASMKEIDLKSELESLVDTAIIKLDAIVMKGGLMPAVIGPGFGAVIFHEAVGHSLEATTVATKLSVVSNKYNKKIGTDKVTLIDDGTIDKLWGSTYYDDEGNKTRKNVLINKGILTSYLIDEINSKKMKMDITGSGRRQNYKFSPTSRMNNTYLMPGTDKIEDMFKSIKYGLYAKEMGGGSVDPITGDFNFAVNEGYIIRDGKVCEPVKLVSLIGNTLEVLNQVEMVSDDLSFDSGFCGSTSGLIYTTIGQPTIKVSKILVGGGQ